MLNWLCIFYHNKTKRGKENKGLCFSSLMCFRSTSSRQVASVLMGTEKLGDTPCHPWNDPNAFSGGGKETMRNHPTFISDYSQLKTPSGSTYACVCAWPWREPPDHFRSKGEMECNEASVPGKEANQWTWVNGKVFSLFGCSLPN